MNDITVYCKRMRLLLENLGMSQREFAEKTGITETAVCRYLQGSRIPNAGTLISIANATHVSVDWLIGFGDDDKMEFIKGA